MWRKKRVLCQPVIDRCCGQNAGAPARGLAVRRNARTECGARKGLVSAADRPLLRAECPRAGGGIIGPSFRGCAEGLSPGMLLSCEREPAGHNKMHLPDGFLDAKTALLSSGVAAAGVGLALRQVGASLEPRRMPMLGLGAAFVFAAQMLNFPIAGGTSGHLVGGVLIAILLGPNAAILVMTCVLMVQCLMFADGGLMALGANVFNMGLVNVCGGYFVFRLLQSVFRMGQQRSAVFAAAFAGWFGTVLASIFCAGELALSNTVPWSIALPAMANVHMIIGLGEGLATGLILLAVLRARPELVAVQQAPRLRFGSGAIGYGLLICLGLAVFVAPFACPWPD